MNNPPQVTTTTANSVLDIQVGQSYTFTLTATDPDVGDTLTWTLTGPSFASIGATTGILALSGVTDVLSQNPVPDLIVQVGDGKVQVTHPLYIRLCRCQVREVARGCGRVGWGGGTEAGQGRDHTE